MKEFNKELTRENIFLLLYYSGLTDEQFSNILSISLRWLRYIKSGKYDFKIEEIERAAKFFNRSFNSITSKSLTIPKNLRSLLIDIHKNNTEYLTPLLANPTIPYAIEFQLLEAPEFKNDALEVKQISKIFEKAGWKFKSSSISNALKQMSNLIVSEPHPTKGGTNVYSRKNK
ncbi:hypothetical protein JHJ32_06815 [Parapedobacter sp. ISTM3]|uniref:hypothetical protein n=1 Tax=Parapedobacter sp. ISTM3 TaxID=2800130 RepID=UPI0019053985|nr:hypothetical protein [Parapedobacter sp. ISTM3]MBK1439688.1 hypothetical protein [Parapedobacter sp. ISTM3]